MRRILDPGRLYGISWYGKQRHTHTSEVRIKDGKKTYPRIKKSVPVSQEEWIGVPVTEPGVPREWVLAAREAIKDNVRVSNCGRRFWELTGGVLRWRRAGVTWGRTSSPPAAWDTTAAVGGTAWDAARASRARTSGQKTPRRSCGTSYRAYLRIPCA